jgi:hypothetical protein
VLIGSLPAARVGDLAQCVGPTDVIVQGSPTVIIGGAMAARIGDMTAHGGVIVTGHPTVLIGEAAGGGDAGSGLSPLAKLGLGAALIVGALLGIDEILAAAALLGEGAEVLEGGALLGDAVEGEAVTVGEESASGFRYGVRQLGKAEPGSVPMTPELKAEIDGANSMTARSAPGYPDLPEDVARNFMDDVRPWNGDEQPGEIHRIIDSDANANGSYWRDSMPKTEGQWRGESAVRNEFNGNRGSVSSSPQGIRGWTGTVRAQTSSDGTSALPGGGQQIWVPKGTANPGPPTPTPWSR